MGRNPDFDERLLSGLEKLALFIFIWLAYSVIAIGLVYSLKQMILEAFGGP